MNLLLFNLKTDADDSVLGFTTAWINALAVHFDHVTVITMDQGRLAVASNVEVYSVGKERGFSETRRLFEFYRILFRVLRARRIDACFAHMMPLFAALASPLLRPMGIPVVLWYAHKSVTPTLRVAHRLVNRVVTSSPEGFQITSRKVVYVGQGISLAAFPARGPAAPDGFTVLSVGRISRIKNIEGILEGFALFVKDNPSVDTRLVFVGGALNEQDRAYEAQVKARAVERGVSDRVVFAGPVRHEAVGEWVARASVSVSLSETMSLDKTILESMVAGVPVLIYNEAFTPVFLQAGVDPAPSILQNGRPETMARGLEDWHAHAGARRDDIARLAACVREHHSLQGLAARVKDQITNLVMEPKS